MNVDRPTGNPNIESGAGLFAQLVKEEGSHVGGPAKEPEGVCRGGREELARETLPPSQACRTGVPRGMGRDPQSCGGS